MYRNCTHFRYMYRKWPPMYRRCHVPKLYPPCPEIDMYRKWPNPAARPGQNFHSRVSSGWVTLLTNEAATSTLSVTTSRSYKDTRSGIHVDWTTATPCCTEWPTNSCGKYTVGTEYRSQTSRTHHTDIASTTLAAGQTTSRIQRFPAWYTKCCQTKYLPIWLTIFVSPRKVLL